MPSLNTGNAILSNAIAVDSSYNVGIGGAASGSYKLQVTGTSNLTGALSGTSATFSSSVTATSAFFNASNGFGLAARNAANTQYRNLIILNSGNQIEIGRDTDISQIRLGTASANDALTIASNGAATFSSSIAATSATFSGNVNISSASSNGFVVNSTNNASFRGFTIQANGTTQGGIELLPNTGEIRIGGYSTTSDYFPVIYSDGVAALTFGIGASPSATFSSSLRVGGATGNFLIDSYTTSRIGVRCHTDISGTTNNFFVQNSANFNYGVVGVVSATGTSTGDVYALGYTPSAGTSMTPVLNWTSGDELLIGTTTATGYRFSVFGGGKYSAYISQSGGTAAFPALTIQHNATSGTIYLEQYYAGGTDVGRITSNGSTITFSGNALSDARHKENIKPIKNALDAVNSIDFVTFNYKENNKQKSAGVTAQQAKTVNGISDFVIDGTDEDSYKAFDYNALIGYLGKAIQELNQKINEQQQTINSLINR